MGGHFALEIYQTRVILCAPYFYWLWLWCLKKRREMRQIRNDCVIEPLESRRLLSVVATDLNFGVQGRVVSDFSVNTSSSWDAVGDAMLQSDGKLLVLGSWDMQGRPDSQERPSTPYLARYNEDGTRDQSFAPGGQIALPVRNGITFYNRMQFLPDGKLLLLGSSFVPGSLGNFGSTRMIFVRLNPDLSLDGTFGSGGVETTNIALRDFHRFSYAVLTDGKILVGGRYDRDGSPAAVWRFTSDALTDFTFGTDGVVQYASGGAFDAMIDNLVLNPDGSFFGTTVQGEAKFNPDGSIDTTFGSQGYLPYPPLSTGIVLKYLLPDGKLLGLERLLVDNGSDVRVSRWNPNGTPDASFGNNGSAQIDLGQWDFASSLNVDSAGRILVGAGVQETCCALPQRVGLARLSSDGQLDSSFGNGGKFTDIAGNGALFVFPTPDNKIITLANTSDDSTEKPKTFNQDQNIAIARYVPGVPLNISIQPTGTVNEGSNFLIDAGGSSYDNGQIVRYEWDNAYDKQSFTADAQGSFTVLRAADNPTTPIALRVTTSDGLRALAPFAIPTRNVPPVPNAGPDRVVLVGNVSLPMSAVDAVRENGTLRVDWGDFTHDTFTFTNANIMQATATHSYFNTGVYTLTLTADDGDGGISTDTAIIRVVNIIANIYQDNDAGGTKTFGEGPFPNGTVWVDLNDNGNVDPNEPINVTDSNGDTWFTGLAAGTYKLRTQLPSGWQPSFADSNFRGDYVTASIPGSGAKPVIGVTQKSGITGTVFNDLNGNGIRDAGEAGISGRGIDFFSVATGAPLNGGFSGTDGFFRIRGLAPDDYRLRAQIITGWVQTRPAGNGSYIVSPGVGQTINNIDFGVRQVAGATAKGFIFEDIDGDGSYGAADRAYYPANSNGQPPVYIDLDNDGGRDLNESLIGISSTDSTWTMPQLAAGTYTFRLMPRLGWVQTFPANNAGETVTLATGDSVTTLNFGFQKTDFVAPQVTSFTFNRSVKPNRIEITFDEPMNPNSPLNLQPVGSAAVSLFATYDAATNTAIYKSSSTPILPDGNYRAFFNPGAPKDQAGNSLTGQSEWSFFVLKGDLDGDRTVSISDFITLASNFGKTNATYSDGDLNYDGQVTISDFIDLSSNFNNALPPPAAIAPQPAAGSEITSSPSTPSSFLDTQPDSLLTRHVKHHRKPHRFSRR
jgi:uncharacterized delta-60 repeat protein